MQKTKSSLYYVVGYLLFGGLGFLFLPQKFLQLLFSNGNYDSIMVRLVGMFMLGISFIVLQIIRKNLVAQLYLTTFIVRLFFTIGLFIFFFFTKDPLFLVLSVIVGFGLLISCLFYFRER